VRSRSEPAAESRKFSQDNRDLFVRERPKKKLGGAPAETPQDKIRVIRAEQDDNLELWEFRH
jgi:hypothetical protein